MTREIEQVFEENMDFYTDHVHPVMVAAVTLQIAVYSELSKRCGDYTGQLFILRSMVYFLEKTKKFYEHKYAKSLDRNNNYMDHSLHPDFETYKKLVNHRKELEHQRYVQWINLNGDFKFKATDEAPAYGNFTFDRCPNYAIKEVENKVNALAVNNKDGRLDNPSIIKDVHDIPARSSSTFTVTMKSTIPNRTLQLAIHELTQGEYVNGAAENKVAGEDWSEYSIKYEKQRDDTFLRFEIYWFDKAEDDLLIRHTYVDFTQVEPLVPDIKYAEILPFPDYCSLRHRSTHKAVYFHADPHYASSLYCAANDAEKTFASPSVYFDLVMMWASDWARLDVTFEAYLKTRKDIGREIHLCIHELHPLGEGNYDIKNSVWSPAFRLTNDWKRYHLTCIRQHHTHIRCEIYWSDHDEVDMMLRDARVHFTVK